MLWQKPPRTELLGVCIFHSWRKSARCKSRNIGFDISLADIYTCDQAAYRISDYGGDQVCARFTGLSSLGDLEV